MGPLTSCLNYSLILCFAGAARPSWGEGRGWRRGIHGMNFLGDMEDVVGDWSDH